MEKNTNQGKYSASQSYLNSTHRLGRVSGIIAVLLILMVPAVITFVYRNQITLDMPKTMSAIITLTAIYGVVSMVEVVSFCPFLGTGGTYLSFITGPELAPAFNNVTPALTGALAAPYFVKNKKLSIPTVIAGCVLYLVMGYSFMSSNYSYLMLAFIVISFLCYLLLYKVGFVKEEK